MERSYKNILVPFDFRDQANIALSQTYNLARLSKLDITLLFVQEESGLFTRFFSADQSDEIMKKMQLELAAYAEQKSQESGLKINSMVAKGKVHAKIVEIADLIHAKFIVMGTASTFDESGKKVVGANTSRVIRSAHCPVVTINSGPHHDGCRSILLPLDLTKETRQKVGWAIEVARLFGATIKVVSVFWSVNIRDVEHQLKAQMNQVVRFIEERNIKCSSEIIEADKESEEVSKILEYSKQQGDVDLIVITTQQETSIIEYFVDSTATELIRLSEIPVLSVIPKDTRETVMW